MLYLEKKRIKNWAMMLLHMRMFAPKERHQSMPQLLLVICLNQSNQWCDCRLLGFPEFLCMKTFMQVFIRPRSYLHPTYNPLAVCKNLFPHFLSRRGRPFIHAHIATSPRLCVTYIVLKWMVHIIPSKKATVIFLSTLVSGNVAWPNDSCPGFQKQIMTIQLACINIALPWKQENSLARLHPSFKALITS